MPLVARHREVGIGHAQQIEDPFPQDSPERLSLDPRQKEAEHVRRYAVVKCRSRLIDERQRGESGHPLVRRQCVLDGRPERRGVLRADGTAMELAVREPGAVREQIAERDRARRGNGVVDGPFRMAEDAQVFELRRDPRNGIVEAETPVIEERERGDGRDRLRHGRDPEDRVATHRNVSFDVSPSEHGGACRSSPMPGKSNDSPKFSSVDVFGNHNSEIIL